MTDDLPASAGNNPVITSSPIASASGGINKELGSLTPSMEAAPVKEVGHETDSLPKEVVSAGVTIHPTTIPISKPVAAMGVQPGQANIPMPTATVALPITDDQIAQGLGTSIRESIRWLAEWCVRRLKQVHVGLKSVHGKLIRVTSK